MAIRTYDAVVTALLFKPILIFNIDIKAGIGIYELKTFFKRRKFIKFI